MGKVIAISNQKGGVGKTTTSINLASGLAHVGKKVLLIDFDSQGNATQGLNASQNNSQATIHSVLMEGVPIQQAIVPKMNPRIDIVPANINLAGADLDMDKMEAGKEELLKKAIAPIRDQYDYIIIDCPPSLGILTTNALAASDSVLIPVQCEYFALEGIMQLINTIMLAQKKVNPSLDIEGVLLTMLTSNTNLGLEVVESIKGFFKERVYETLRICGLYGYRNWPISALSFGQKKRVTIDSILVLNPDMIILDEPTAGQDFKHYTEIMEFLVDLNKKGVTILMVTHDMHLMLEYTNKVIVLSEGEKIADNIPAYILTNKEIIEKANLKETSLHQLALKCDIEDTTKFVNKFIDYDRRVR